MKRYRIRQLDLIRMICTWGIFIFHFFVNRSSLFGTVGTHGGYTGGIFVAVFFMLSGYCLMLTSSEIRTNYFVKRALAIYPAFWIAYMFYYMQRVFYTGTLFWDTSIKNVSIIESIVGVDGLLAIHGLKNYYLVGEWFLGAILFLYLLYPILLMLIRKSKLMFAIVIYSLYGLEMLIDKTNSSFFKVGTDYNLLTCMCCFGTGMLLKHILELCNMRFWVLVGSITVICGFFVPNGTICNICLGLGIFILNFFISPAFLKIDGIYKIVNFFSSISYPFFLIHHQIIESNSAIYEKNLLIAYIFVLTITIVYAWCLSQVAKILTQKISNIVNFTKE